jgi:transposase
MTKRNAEFGIQLTQEEKRRKAIHWFVDLAVDVKQMALDLAVSESKVYEWISRKRKDLKVDQKRKASEMWLACYTEDAIGATIGVDRSTVSTWMKKPLEIPELEKFTVFSDYREPDWKSPIYNVWKRQDKTNKTSHFGNSEALFTDYLLYLYTEPFDIVVDPFAGGGSTIDVCKHRLRRYWVSDRLPIIERRDIREHDILQGPPPLHKRWGDVALLYLDPPYWKQAAGQYSKDAQDLANMELDQFHQTLSGFIEQCATKMKAGSHIAMLMQPTQWFAPDRRYVIDHTFEIRCLLCSAPLRFVKTIQAPYESQQANAQQVEWAKENRDVLELGRTITVWEIIS